MKKITIGGRIVGEGESCFIIAEAGSNHNRDFAQALKLIDVAKEAGADAVKFQTYSAESLYSKKTPKMSYLKKKALAINFDFNTRYEPNVGLVRIGGELLFLTEKNKEVMDTWGKDKKLPDDVSVNILNYLFRKCLLKIANIAEELQLPLPLAMPKISPKENKA